MAVYLAYVDDSGDESVSWHSAVLVPVERWSEHLGQWKKYRLALKKKHGVAPEYELHAVHWIPGKGFPAEKPDAPINTVQGHRREWAIKALQTVRAMTGLRVFTVQTQTAVKRDAYVDFLGRLDKQLAARGAHAIVVMDGDPATDSTPNRAVHRDLTLRTRRIIEDCWIQESRSQFIQMADFVVHCVFQHHARSSSRKYMWDWYPEHVHDLEWECACRLLSAHNEGREVAQTSSGPGRLAPTGR